MNRSITSGSRLQSVPPIPLHSRSSTVLNGSNHKVLAADIIPEIQDIQLFTIARHVGVPADDAAGTWCWFDIVILENANATEPRVKDSDRRALVWSSHVIPRTNTSESDEQKGKLFGRDSDIFGFLNVGPLPLFFVELVPKSYCDYFQGGNVIAVRACARFRGWELDAHSARLVVRISNKGMHLSSSHQM